MSSIRPNNRNNRNNNSNNNITAGGSNNSNNNSSSSNPCVTCLIGSSESIYDTVEDYRIVILGPCYSGKTSLCYQFVSNRFVNDHYPIYSPHQHRQHQRYHHHHHHHSNSFSSFYHSSSSSYNSHHHQSENNNNNNRQSFLSATTTHQHRHGHHHVKKKRIKRRKRSRLINQFRTRMRMEEGICHLELIDLCGIVTNPTSDPSLARTLSKSTTSSNNNNYPFFNRNNHDEYRDDDNGDDNEHNDDGDDDDDDDNNTNDQNDEKSIMEMRNRVIREADGFIIMFDMSNFESSFIHVEHVMHQLMNTVKRDVMRPAIVLAANKSSEDNDDDDDGGGDDLMQQRRQQQPRGGEFEVGVDDEWFLNTHGDHVKYKGRENSSGSANSNNNKINNSGNDTGVDGDGDERCTGEKTPYEKVEAFAKKWNIPWIDLSVLNNRNVTETFQCTVMQIRNRRPAAEYIIPTKRGGCTIL